MSHLEICSEDLENGAIYILDKSKKQNLHISLDKHDFNGSKIVSADISLESKEIAISKCESSGDISVSTFSIEGIERIIIN